MTDQAADEFLLKDLACLDNERLCFSLSTRKFPRSDERILRFFSKKNNFLVRQSRDQKNRFHRDLSTGDDQKLVFVARGFQTLREAMEETGK